MQCHKMQFLQIYFHDNPTEWNLGNKLTYVNSKQTFGFPYGMLISLEKQTESKSYQLKNELSKMKAVSIEKP